MSNQCFFLLNYFVVVKLLGGMPMEKHDDFSFPPTLISAISEQ